MRLILAFLLFHISMVSLAQDCISVETPTELGEDVTFYVYAYHTNQFRQELRVSPVFKVSFNYDPTSGVDYIKVALRISRDFMFFVRDMRGEEEPHTPYPIAQSTQNKGVYVCVNREAVVESRIQRMEEFIELDRPVIEEKSYQFKYKFNSYYKASTQVTVTKL